MTVAQITQRLASRNCDATPPDSDLYAAAKAIAERDGCAGQTTFPCVPNRPGACVCLQEARDELRAAIARAEAAESAQREAVAEVARLREALRTIRDEGNGWAVSVAIGALPKETAHD